LPNSWTASNPPVAASHLVNLEPNTTYYVCPYFVNWFGDFYGDVTSFETGQYRWRINADVRINGVTQHYSSDVFLGGYPYFESGTAYMPDFKWTEMGWWNPFRYVFGSDFRFIHNTTRQAIGLSAREGLTDNVRIEMYVPLPVNTGDAHNGIIDFSGESAGFWGGWTGVGADCGGTFTLTRVE